MNKNTYLQKKIIQHIQKKYIYFRPVTMAL